MTRTLLRAMAALVALSSVIAVSGCATPSTATDASLDFKFSYPATQNSPYAALAEKYMKEHPGVTVTLDGIPAENYDTILSTQLQGGNAADVVMALPGSGTSVSLISLAEADLISALSDSVGDLVPEASTGLFYWDKKLWGQPTDISVTGVVFNSSSGADYPDDQGSLMKQCRALPEGESFFAIAGSVAINTGLVALSIAGPNVYAEDPDWDDKRADGAVTFAGTDGWRDTLQTIVDLQDGGCFQPGAEGGGFDAIVQGIGQGKSLAAFVPGGVATELAAGEGPELVVESFPPPAGSERFVFASSDYALAIPKSAAHEKGARAFLDWFAEPENAAAYAELAGTIPITGIEGINLEGTPYEAIQDLLADTDYVPLPATVWTTPEVFDTLSTGVQALLTKQQTVDGLLADLDAAWDKS